MQTSKTGATMTGETPTTERVQHIVEYLGGTVVDVTRPGQVDFELDHIPGFARVSRGRLRTSFFIAYDPDAAEAERFVAQHNDLPQGEAQFVEVDDGGFIRLLVELPFDSWDEISTAALSSRRTSVTVLPQDIGDTSGLPGGDTSPD